MTKAAYHRHPARTTRVTTKTALLRTSERTLFNRCRFSHHLSYNIHLTPKREAPALRFGTLIHAALERYYTPLPKGTKRQRIHPATIFQTLYAEELTRTREAWPEWRDDDGEWHDYLALGVAMLEGYVKRWSAQDDEYIVLATEQTFQTPIVFPDQWNGANLAPKASPRTYVGTFDRILYDKVNRRLLLGDYKTTKSDPTKTGHLALDEQAGAYWAMAPRWLHESAPAALQAKIRRRLRALPPSVRRAVTDDDGRLRFDGILYDFLRKGLPDERPTDSEGHSLNKDGSVSKMQPTPLFHRETVYRDAGDRAHVLERVWQDAVEIGQVREGTLALKKSPDYFHCLNCQFKDLCELHETGNDWEAMAKVTMTGWDPFSAHSIQDDAHEAQAGMQR